MAYTFDPIFAADPNNAANVAANASIIIFDPADAGKAPITLVDVTGAALPNPITVNKNGFGPAFVSTLDRVAWFGGGFTGYFTSYEGIKAAAVAAQVAAENAGASAGAAATASLAAAVADADSAAAAAVASAAAAATSAGLVGAPADSAVQTLINTPSSATATALSATFDRVFKPEAYGALADGATNDAAAITAAFTAAAGANGGTVLFSANKVYATASALDLPATVAIALRMEPGAKIKATAAMDHVLRKPTGGPATGILLQDVSLDGNGLATRVLDIIRAHHPIIRGGNYQNAAPGGTVVDFGRTGEQVYEIEWSGGLVTGRDASYGGAIDQLPTYGIHTGGLQVTDSRFNGIEIKNARTLVQENGQANWWDKVHLYCYPYKTATETMDWSVGSIGFDVPGNHNRFVSCYADTMNFGFVLTGTTNLIQNPLLLWPGSHTPAYSPVGVKLIGQANMVNAGHWQVGNPAATTLTGIEVGATAYNSIMTSNRFVGGSSFGALPIVYLGSALDHWRLGNFWSNGTISDTTRNRVMSTVDIDLGVAADIILRYRGDNPGRFTASGTGATGKVVWSADTANGGLAIGASNNKVGFFGWGPAAKQDATTDLATALVNYGLLLDGTERSARTGVKGRNATATLTTAGAEVQTIDATSGAISITLPATTTPGIRFTIKKTDVSANAVTVVGTIDGATNYSLATQYKYVAVVSTSVSGSWLIVGNN